MSTFPSVFEHAQHFPDAGLNQIFVLRQLAAALRRKRGRLFVAGIYSGTDHEFAYLDGHGQTLTS
jgi:hypothetical protein